MAIINNNMKKLENLKVKSLQAYSNLHINKVAVSKRNLSDLLGAASADTAKKISMQLKSADNRPREMAGIFSTTVAKESNINKFVTAKEHISSVSETAFTDKLKKSTIQLKSVTSEPKEMAGIFSTTITKENTSITPLASKLATSASSTDYEDMSISFRNLRVAPYEVEHILDVKVVQKVNEHGTLYFKGLLSDEKKDTYANTFTEETNVVLSVEESGADYILFQGVVQDVKVQAAAGEYYLEVQAVSYSYLLDIEKKSRSFQDKKKTYEQLTMQVTTQYPGAGVLDVVSNDVPTNKFIMQHMETDWEFVKRLASHFNTGLVCDVRFNKPLYYFGIPQIQSIELECFDYSVKKDMQKYKQLSENGIADLFEDDFIYYEVETDKLVYIGDEVQFQNKKLYVAEIIGTIDKGEFINHIVLTRKKGLSQLYQYHDNVVGGSFNGHITEIQNDRVKVYLDIDKGHDPGELCFFPYSTIYSSQDGSGWYCMPEMGDTVRIYFPDGEEDHAYAVSSVHEQVDSSQQQQGSAGVAGAGGSGGADTGGYSGQRDDPNVKSLRTKSGKEIRLTPEGIYIITDGTTITLTDEDGVMIMSENNIEFKSDKNIIISAEEDVNIVGTTGVDLMCSETASIKMKDNVEIVGQEIKSN